MSDTPDNQGAETEKGFGTGLRAQLQRRREGDDGTQADGQGPTNVELRFELTARPAAGGNGDAFEVGVGGPDVQALKAELEAAQAREATLRDQLQERSHAYEQNVGSEKELAHRALTLDERDAKLAEFQAELEERERRVRDQREAIEAEHTRVADLQAELAAEQALAAEHQEAAEKRLRDLQGADRQREKASTELSKARAALDDREQKVARKESEVATREQAGTARLDGRERALTKRENEWRARDKELSERERRLGQREGDL
jgi:DNA repair exonuclease SbcCD ATPase subunit